MQEAFGVVIFVVVLAALVIAVLTMASGRRAFDEIGRGGLSLRDGSDRSVEPAPSGAGALRERDDEVRQMLAARNARRARRGEPPLDVEAELARLTTTSPATGDPALAAEVRALVVARNERRARRGEPPLDVDDEVARQLRELG